MDAAYLLDTQLYALFFIIGALTVKSLTEMKNWASRRDIWELWFAFLIIFIVHDVALRPYRLRELGAKWLLISGTLALFYFKEIDFIVRDDKIALLAVMSILPLQEIALFIALYLVLVLALKRHLKHGFSHASKIPTMPLLTTSLISVLLISIFVIGIG